MKRNRYDDDFEIVDDFDDTDDYGMDDYDADNYHTDNRNGYRYGKTDYLDDYEEDDFDEEEDELVRMRNRNRQAREARKGRRQERPAAGAARRREQPVKAQQPSKSGQSRNSQTRYAGTEGAAHRRQAERLKKKKRKRKLLILSAVLILISAFAAFSYWGFYQKTKDGFLTVAIFGVDSRNGKLEEGNHSDVEMVASLNWETGEIRLLSVYRDTYLQIDKEGTFHKINQAYFDGGHKQAVEALERNLDIKIDNYITFNWKAVIDAINILGGIDIDITDSEFAYINSFITETVESTGVGSVHLEHAGPNHLDGVQAVAYSRLRLMDTDFNRTERQRKVISLAMDKAKQSDFSVLNNILVSVLPQTSTDIGIDDMIPLAKHINRYSLGQTGGFPFAKGTKKISKRDCVIPQTLKTNVVQLHQFLFDDTEYTPSAEIQRISAKISEDSGMYEAGTSTGPDQPVGGSSGGNGGGKAENPAPPAPAETPAPEIQVDNGAETSETETVESEENDAEDDEVTEGAEENQEEDPEDPDAGYNDENTSDGSLDEGDPEESDTPIGPGEALLPSEPNAGPGGNGLEAGVTGGNSSQQENEPDVIQANP